MEAPGKVCDAQIPEKSERTRFLSKSIELPLELNFRLGSSPYQQTIDIIPVTGPPEL